MQNVYRIPWLKQAANLISLRPRATVIHWMWLHSSNNKFAFINVNCDLIALLSKFNISNIQMHNSTHKICVLSLFMLNLMKTTPETSTPGTTTLGTITLLVNYPVGQFPPIGQLPLCQLPTPFPNSSAFGHLPFMSITPIGQLSSWVG